jgi:hypothetical protein
MTTRARFVMGVTAVLLTNIARVGSAPPPAPAAAPPADALAAEHSLGRREDDFGALAASRPGYRFWQHIFTIPDGSIAYGSARDGRLLAVFPAKGDWSRDAIWIDPTLSASLKGQPLPSRLDDRRDRVAEILEPIAGPVLHNPTRGNFLLPNVPRYGRFLEEWAAIYERFAVPPEIGLAQVILESGLSGTRRSEARAIGFCQWLLANWKRLNQLAPDAIEGYNQTTQAPYCAAHLTILATKYGSFIPALSEHNAGGTNVGRTLINGERLGGSDVRQRYFLGADLARDLRALSLRGYRDIYRTYGPRSYRYAEMVFGNTANVARLAASVPQVKIHAMRTTRRIPIAEVTRRAGLSVDEVRRFNPALQRYVPAQGTLYLPKHVAALGADVTYWHRPASAPFAAALNDFVRLEVTPEAWDDPAFAPVLRAFQRRFSDTKTEEGSVMATVLAYVIDDTYSSRRGPILAEFRNSADVQRLFEHGLVERAAARAAAASPSGERALATD